MKAFKTSTCCPGKKWKKVVAFKVGWSSASFTGEKRTTKGLLLLQDFLKGSRKTQNTSPGAWAWCFFEILPRNFLVGLGGHTMPVFLFKGEFLVLQSFSEILPELRSEFVFRPQIRNLAEKMLRWMFDVCLSAAELSLKSTRSTRRSSM